MRTLLKSLRDAIDAGDWLTVASLMADAIKLIIGPTAAASEDLTAEISAVEASLWQRQTAPQAAADPANAGTWMQIVLLVLELLKSRKK